MTIAGIAFVLATIMLLAPSPPFPFAPPAALTPTQAEKALNPDTPEEKLTDQKWQRVQEREGGLANEVTTWEFYADGSFRWQFVSDYEVSSEGAWAISEVSDSRGIIFLAIAAAQSQSSRFEVLSFEFSNGSLQLGEQSYQGIPFTDSDVPPLIGPEEHEAVTTSQRNRFFPLWVAMTATDWRSQSPPPPGDPDMYSFATDGTYSALFSDSQCQYSGTWSVFNSLADSGEIRLSIPANQCDPRGPRDAYVLEMPVTLNDTTLSLYQTDYINDRGGEKGCNKQKEP